MSSHIISMISSVASVLATPIMEQMKYLFNLRANMRKLKKAVDDLEATKKEVDVKIKSATEARDDEVPTERVHKWLDEVQIAVSKATKIESDHNQLKMCFGGCSLNCWAGYKISKQAVKALEEVNDLEKEREEKMDAVTEKVVPARRPMPDSTLPLPATEILLGNAINNLKDETVGVIGIWGMGGVGKTTLLKRINNHPEVESAGYNFVIWAVVSQEFNAYNLQRDIAKRVGLPLEEQDSTTELQAERLRHFLKDQKLLLLLDDIWQAFDLEKLGIPIHGSSNNRVPHSKVVFTTRSEKVCDGMAAFLRQVRHKKIKVECLKPEEAWELFIANTGEIVQSIIKSDRRVHVRAERVANKCAGLPLALVVIARAMSGNKTWREWEEAVNSINDLRLPELLVGDSDPLYPVLKVSYDRLVNDEMRKCFLCCALWPEDFDIPKEDVIRCWLGMGLITDFSNINVAISKGHSIIESLKGAAMLEETSTEKDFRICVKLHDIIRGMALWIASDCGKKRSKWIVRTGVEINIAAEEEEGEKWKEAEIISLMHSKIRSLKQFPNCPILNALLLRYTDPQEYLDVDGLIQTPALTYVDLSISKGNDYFRSNFSYFRSSFAVNVSNLVGLQCLDLSGHKLKSLPKEFENLSKLKYLFIRDGSIERIPHGLISGLQKLEILDLSNTIYARWEEEGEASLAELGSINAGRLKGLGISLPPYLLQRLSSSSSNHPHGGLPPLWHLQIVNDLTRTFRLSKELFPGGIFPRTLQSLELIELLTVKEIFIAGGKEDQFDNLEVLKFKKVEKLEKMSWEGGVVPHVLFQNLSSLTFSYCHKLKDVSWIAHLPYLEILCIDHCNRMENVIVIRGAAAEDDDEGQGEEAAQEQVKEAAAQNNRPLNILPNLKFLQLYELCNLRSFCSPQITLPSLQRVEIYECLQLNLSFLKETKAKVTIGKDGPGPETHRLWKKILYDISQL